MANQFEKVAQLVGAIRNVIAPIGKRTGLNFRISRNTSDTTEVYTFNRDAKNGIIVTISTTATRGKMVEWDIKGILDFDEAIADVNRFKF